MPANVQKEPGTTQQICHKWVHSDEKWHTVTKDMFRVPSSTQVLALSILASFGATAVRFVGEVVVWQLIGFIGSDGWTGPTLWMDELNGLRGPASSWLDRLGCLGASHGATEWIEWDWGYSSFLPLSTARLAQRPCSRSLRPDLLRLKGFLEVQSPHSIAPGEWRNESSTQPTHAIFHYIHSNDSPNALDQIMEPSASWRQSPSIGPRDPSDQTWTES